MLSSSLIKLKPLKQCLTSVGISMSDFIGNDLSVSLLNTLLVVLDLATSVSYLGTSLLCLFEFLLGVVAKLIKYHFKPWYNHN